MDKATRAIRRWVTIWKMRVDIFIQLNNLWLHRYKRYYIIMIIIISDMDERCVLGSSVELCDSKVKRRSFQLNSKYKICYYFGWKIDTRKLFLRDFFVNVFLNRQISSFHFEELCKKTTQFSIISMKSYLLSQILLFCENF